MFTEFYGRDIQKISNVKRQKVIKNAANFWREQGFPYIEYSSKEIKDEFLKFKDTLECFRLDGDTIGYSTVGLGIANSFHPQMWRVPSQGHTKSPIDHFNNDETLTKLLERAIKFWPDRRCWSHYSIRNLFRIYAGGRVSNFRPTAASFIINRFSNKEDCVLDFCAGFGGRLLAALALDRQYFGIDASHQQVRGLLKMTEALKGLTEGKARVLHGTAEEILPTLKSESFNLIFTSPPYFDLEKYNKAKNQSFMKYKSYAEWKTGFLSTVINESHRLLTKNGRLVINIANTSSYPIASDFNSMAVKYFKSGEKLNMLMNARPLQRVNGLVYRHEPVFVYKKR